jgi:DnaK suppressor protein
MPRATKTAQVKKAGTRRAEGAQKTQKAVVKKAVVKKAAVKKTAVKKATPAKKSAPVKKAPTKATTPRRAEGAQKTQKAAVKKAAPAPAKKAPAAAKRRSPVLDKFLLEQQALLQEERARHVEQAQELRAEADQIAAEMEPGDVQFDEESGEGTTTAIDRERDLALSQQAQAEVEEVDHALAKIQAGTYGTCERCGQAIPKVRLKAIPQARLCIACKSGGLSRR